MRKTINDGLGLINESDEEVDFPINSTTQEAYEKIMQLLIKNPYRWKELAFTFGCAVIAALAGYYNYAFGKEYVHDVSRRWGFTHEEAELFSTFCGLVGLIINTAINGKSIHQAFHVVKDEITKSWKNKESMPDDNMIGIVFSIMTILSVIGALPNLKFVYDAIGKGNRVYLYFMEAIQFLTVSTLNFRGLYNTVKINSEKKLVARKFKLEMLTALNECLVNLKPLSSRDLTSLSQGVLVRNKASAVRWGMKKLTGLYVGGYSAAFYFSVRSAVNISSTTNILTDLALFGVTACGLLSSALKWFLLGNAYAGLVDRIFNLFQEPILKTNQNEIRSKYISRNTDRILAAIGFTFAIFSLGSSSKVVEKYFFDEDKRDTETFFISLLIGGGAAFGINAMDLSTIIERIIDLGMHIFKTAKPPRDSLEYLGKSHDEMILRAMLEVAMMSDAAFLNNYFTEIKGNQTDLLVSSLYTNPGERNPKAPSFYLHGYIPNDNYTEFLDCCAKLSEDGDNINFEVFKETKKSQVEMDQQVREFLDEEPLLRFA